MPYTPTRSNDWIALRRDRQSWDLALPLTGGPMVRPRNHFPCRNRDPGPEAKILRNRRYGKNVGENQSPRCKTGTRGIRPPAIQPPALARGALPATVVAVPSNSGIGVQGRDSTAQS